MGIRHIFAVDAVSLTAQQRLFFLGQRLNQLGFKPQPRWPADKSGVITYTRTGMYWDNDFSAMLGIDIVKLSRTVPGDGLSAYDQVEYKHAGETSRSVVMTVKEALGTVHPTPVRAVFSHLAEWVRGFVPSGKRVSHANPRL